MSDQHTLFFQKTTAMFAVSAEMLLTCKLNSCKPPVLQPINHSSAISKFGLDTIFYTKPVSFKQVASVDLTATRPLRYRRPEFVTRTRALFTCYCAIVLMSDEHVWLTCLARLCNYSNVWACKLMSLIKVLIKRFIIKILTG